MRNFKIILVFIFTLVAISLAWLDFSDHVTKEMRKDTVRSIDEVGNHISIINNKLVIENDKEFEKEIGNVGYILKATESSNFDLKSIESYDMGLFLGRDHYILKGKRGNVIGYYSDINSNSGQGILKEAGLSSYDYENLVIMVKDILINLFYISLLWISLFGIYLLLLSGFGKYIFKFNNYKYSLLNIYLIYSLIMSLTMGVYVLLNKAFITWLGMFILLLVGIYYVYKYNKLELKVKVKVKVKEV